MSFWRRLFGQRSIPSGIDSVSCMDVVHTIRKQVAEFKRLKGMVAIILEGRRVQLYFFDGIARVTWGYNNHQFITDRVGQTFLIGPPIKLMLTANTQSLLPDILRSEFGHYDISIGALWKLDPTAWDYEDMKTLPHSIGFSGKCLTN